VTNADVGRESFYFPDGGDDRGGRRERWHFVLTDEHGDQVRQSNFMPMMGGGVCSVGPLAYGASGSRVNFFDLRQYIAPPASGKYRLQAFYHNRESIAGENDLAGLIVSNSNPVEVIVENPTPALQEKRRSTALQPLAILLSCAALTAISVASRARTRSVWGISRRDLCWSSLIAGLAIGMWLDQRHQESQINVRPDAAAEWSIQLVN
jgi:hypothetical protein